MDSWMDLHYFKTQEDNLKMNTVEFEVCVKEMFKKEDIYEIHIDISSSAITYYKTNENFETTRIKEGITIELLMDYFKIPFLDLVVQNSIDRGAHWISSGSNQYFDYTISIKHNGKISLTLATQNYENYPAY